MSVVRDYYARRLSQYGVSARGVDWRDSESQAMRFTVLLEVLISDDPVTLAELGCGYGALLDHLDSRPEVVLYEGIDVVPEMIDAAVALHRTCGIAHPEYQFRVGSDPTVKTDFTVASGILNVKAMIEELEWERHVWATVSSLANGSARGFAYNSLSVQSQPSKRRPDLYYGDPDEHRAFVERLGWSVELRTDYGLWEFTLLARR